MNLQPEFEKLEKELKPDVWIVDDDESIRKVITRMIESLFKLKVKTFSRGEEMLKEFDSNPEAAPQIIFVDGDFGSGNLNGPSIVNSLRTKGYKGLIVAFSADEKLLEEMIKCGANTKLKKPFTISDLKEIFEKIHSE